MILYVDTVTRKLRRSVADSREVNSLQFKRGDSAEIQIVFVTAGVQVELADGTTITFGIKSDGIFDGEFLVSTSDFTKSGSGATAVYTGNPSFNTTALNTALGVDLATNNDIARLKVGVEISWEDGASGAITSTETIAGYVHNDVIKGDEGTPDEAATPDDEWVAHGHSQSLTTGQKEQVSANIATSSGHTSPSQILSTDGSGRTRARQFIALASTFNGSITVLDTGIVAFVGASASFSTTLSFEEAASSDRSVVIPDAEGTLPPLPAYSSLSAANAAEAAIGIVFWNTTSGKAQVTTATS